MLDIAFSNAVRGCLQVARHDGLDGGRDPIVCLDLALNVGDISEPLPGPLRRRALVDLIAPADGSQRAEKAAGELLSQAEEALALILDGAGQGEPMRLWYSGSSPGDLCGLCWLMDRLEVFPDAKIAAVPLPRYHQRQDGVVVVYKGWGEVEPSLYKTFSTLAEVSSRPLRLAWAIDWQNLRQENAPLRAVIDGRLVSVAADFYDPFLRRELARMPVEFSEAHLLGNTLGRHQLQVGDGFLAGRVEAMIQAGELEVLTTAPAGEPLYRRILRKRTF